MTKYKLTYFNPKGGLGEPIRILFAYMDQEFEDCVQKHDTWAEEKKKTLFGKLPILEVDDKVYCQSTAICRYLGAKAGLNGKTDLENLEIDMIVGTFFDFIGELSSFHHQKDPNLKEQLKEKILNEHFPYYFSLYEERVKNHNYLANNKLSWADIFLVANLEKFEEMLGEKILEKYPYINALREQIFNIPNIKKYMEKRAE